MMDVEGKHPIMRAIGLRAAEAKLELGHAIQMTGVCHRAGENHVTPPKVLIRFQPRPRSAGKLSPSGEGS